MNESFHSGYVALIGRPNAGKSTLLNAILGEKLAIVTPKPQTTRQQIRGIHSGEGFQMIFVDTPGYHNSKIALNQAMIESAINAARDADVVVYLFDATLGITKEDKAALAAIKDIGAPLLCLLNKVDKVKKPDLLPLMQKVAALAPWNEIIPVSATRADGVQIVLDKVRALLPEGPLYFPADQLSDANERFRAAEIIREKAFQLLGQELPYSTAVEIEEFREEGKLNRIAARIHVERESQKGMVIGKGGKTLKEIGTRARKDLEALWDKKVFLEVFVDVRKDWTKNPRYIKEFGYDGN